MSDPTVYEWPTLAGRRWLLTCYCLVIVIASQVAGSNEKHRVFSPAEYPGRHWMQVKKPEDRGWSSEKLAAAKAYADSIDTAAVVVVDDGVIISQWGETATKFKVHSIRKSFLSALYGIAVAHGEINLNATLEQLGIDDNEPSLTPEEKQARVIDLLKARSGIDLPDGSFSAWGAEGHFIAVIPAFNIVVVHRVNTDDPAKKVTLDQFGELLRLILAAKDQ